MIFVGIDVAEERGCILYALDDGGDFVGAEWTDVGEATGTIESILRVISGWKAIDPDIVVGVDAPRMPLSSLRTLQWIPKRQTWIASPPKAGRHCEVVVRSLGLANPQWTPLVANAPGWMKLGFRMFDVLAEVAVVHEVFPTASLTLLKREPKVLLSVPASHLDRGAKDVIDACVGAHTVRDFTQGRGAAIGGGDGCGTIVLPRDPGVPPALARFGPQADS